MGGRFGVGASLALAIAGMLAAGLVPSASLAAGGGGDFIIRCFYNGHAVTQDPIEAPGSSNTDHLHIFFGNLASGGAAGDGTAFPHIHSGDSSTSSDTMENNGLTPAANCQDSKDTAGYWMPEPFRVSSSGSPSVLGDLGSGCTTSCDPSTDVYQRDYYDPHGATANQEIPDGTIMIAGYPAGCTPYNGITPSGCQAGVSYPVDVSVTGVPTIVEYDCGGDQNHNLATPDSSWPYNCKNYTDADDSFFDGPVAIVYFPDCWNGNADWAPPNDPNGPKVPGYVAPWIPDPSAPVNADGTRANDFTSPNSSGNCPSSYPTPVVQLSERVHLVNAVSAGWGEPSTCTGISGIGWNTTANGENSTVEGAGDTDGDADATVLVNPGPPALYGFHKCVAASSPSPNPNSGSTLSSTACIWVTRTATSRSARPPAAVARGGRATWGPTGTGLRPCTPTTGKPGRRDPAATPPMPVASKT